MNCLVTGATGFLGRHLTKVLHSRDFKRVTGYTGLMEVTISNSKTNSLDRLENLTHLKEKFDYIFHLAAVTKAGDYCLTHQGDQWISNQKINTNKNKKHCGTKKARMCTHSTENCSTSEMFHKVR